MARILISLLLLADFFAVSAQKEDANAWWNLDSDGPEGGGTYPYTYDPNNPGVGTFTYDPYTGDGYPYTYDYVTDFTVGGGDCTAPETEQECEMCCYMELGACSVQAQEDADWDECMDANDACVTCLLYTSPSPRDYAASRMPSSA